MIITGFFLLWPLRFIKTKCFYRNLLSLRWEMYSVRDGVYYNHFKKGGVNSRAEGFKGSFWM
jgi:ubiquinol-cytochrome c reductase cytochrome c1 subunit